LSKCDLPGCDKEAWSEDCVGRHIYGSFKPLYSFTYCSKEHSKKDKGRFDFIADLHDEIVGREGVLVSIKRFLGLESGIYDLVELVDDDASIERLKRNLGLDINMKIPNNWNELSDQEKIEWIDKHDM